MSSSGFRLWAEKLTSLCWFQDHHPSQQGQGGSHGIYLRAFCTGLDSVLQPYRQALLDLEQEVRRDMGSHTSGTADKGMFLIWNVLWYGQVEKNEPFSAWLEGKFVLCDCPSHGQSGRWITAEVPEWVSKSPSFGFVIIRKSELIIFCKWSILSTLKWTLSLLSDSLLVFTDEIDSRYCIWSPNHRVFCCSSWLTPISPYHMSITP